MFQMPVQGFDSLDERRKRLMEALGKGEQAGFGGRLLGPRPGPRRSLPLFGGGGRRAGSMTELPAAALPALNYNPWLAQLRQGAVNLAPPTRVNLPSQATPMQASAPAPGVPGAPAPNPTPFQVMQEQASSQAASGGLRWLSNSLQPLNPNLAPHVQAARPSPQQYDPTNFYALAGRMRAV